MPTILLNRINESMQAIACNKETLDHDCAANVLRDVNNIHYLLYKQIQFRQSIPERRDTSTRHGVLANGIGVQQQRAPCSLLEAVRLPRH